MIAAVKPKDIPQSQSREHTPARRFADEAVAEFMGSAFEACEVSGWPDGCSVSQVYGALQRAAHHQDVGRKVRVRLAQGRIYLERR